MTLMPSLRPNRNRYPELTVACLLGLLLMLPTGAEAVVKKAVVKPVVKQATTNPVNSASPTTLSALSDMETSVFRRQYSQDTVAKRLDRLERFTLGETKPSTTPVESRISNLRKLLPDMAAITPLTPEVAPPATTKSPPAIATQSQQPIQQTIIQPNAPEPEDDGDYADPPSQAVFTPQVISGIAQMEQRIFNKTYNHETPDVRMARLEMRMFNEMAPEMEPEERLYRVASVLKAQDSSQQEKVAGNGFLPPPGMTMGSNMQMGSRNGIYINGMPLNPNNQAFQVYGNRNSGRMTTRRSNNIMPQLLMILLQSLL